MIKKDEMIKKSSKMLCFVNFEIIFKYLIEKKKFNFSVKIMFFIKFISK